jgi:ribosomal protein S18 acetylase RimI-like enzyme
MSGVPAVRLRAATVADHAFVVEMARHACIIEDWPLPDPDDDEVLTMLPPAGEVPIIAEDRVGEPLGATWTWHNDPPLRLDAAGRSIPELCIGVAPGRRGAGIGGMLLDALLARCATTMDVLCTNVHGHNPAQRLYRRKGFVVAGQGRGPLGVAMLKDLR